MLGTLYVGTTIASWVLLGLTSIACNERMKREGYEIIKEKKSISERIIDFVKIAFNMSIPGLNILSMVVNTLKFDKTYERVKNSLIESGKAVKKDKNDQQVDMNIKTKGINNTKKYTDLSNESKLRLLEEERDRLLREKNGSNNLGNTNESYNSRGAYSKKK